MFLFFSLIKADLGTITRHCHGHFKQGEKRISPLASSLFTEIPKTNKAQVGLITNYRNK